MSARVRGLRFMALAIVLAGCATAGDGLDVASLPVDVRADYAVFARRCSKCHSLARPLNSGIEVDTVWVDYVNRMRRQPGSGITTRDMEPILRFLHHYSLEQRRRKGAPPSLGAATDEGALGGRSGG